MAGEVGPPIELMKTTAPVQYGPGVVVTPANTPLPVAYAKPGIFDSLKSMPKPVLIGGAILLAYLFVAMRKR